MKLDIGIGLHSPRLYRRAGGGVSIPAAAGGGVLLTGEANGFGVDFLHAVDAERVSVKETLGPELVTNGGFDSGTGWTADPDWTISGGVASKVASAGARNLDYGLLLTSGRTYKFTFTTVISAGGFTPSLGSGLVPGSVVTATGTYSINLTATAAHTNIRFNGLTTMVGTIDNVSLREVVSVGGTETSIASGLDAFFANGSTSPKQVYNSAGVLGWSPHNYCVQSQTLNVTWNPTTVTVVTPDAIAAPDGTLTADKLTNANTTLTNHSIIGPNTTGLLAGAIYTFQVWAKAAEWSWIAIEENNLGTHKTYFDLANGVLGNVNAFHTSATITAGTNGWYLCRITWTSSGTASQPMIFLQTANGQATVAGVVGAGVYLWGAQVNRGSVPTAYLPTTTAARFGLALDHDPSTLAPRGLLCEPAATNLHLRSQELNNVYWAVTNATVGVDATADPLGTSTADAFIPTAGSSAKQFYNNTAITVVAGTTYTYSMYVKNGSLGSNWILLSPTTTATVRVWFNLATGVKGASAGAVTNYTIMPAGNGWYRITVTWVPDGTAFYSYNQTVDADNSLGAMTGNGTSPAFYLWGAQLETGAIATSPIPTFAATATRAVDNYSVPTASINHSATAGTWWLEHVQYQTGAFRTLTYTNTYSPIATTLGSGYNSYDGVTLTKAIATIAGTAYKIASAFAAGSRAVTVDGLTPTADASSCANFLTPGANVHFGGVITGANYCYIRKAYYVPRRMSNAELQTKTAYSPLELGALLLGWWDADRLDLITLVDTNRVSVWADIVAGYAPAQGSTGARPEYNATVFNGRPGVVFDGTNYHLTLNSVPFPVGAAPSEVWALVDQTAVAGGVLEPRIAFGYGQAADVGRRLGRVVIATVNRARANIGEGSSNTNATDTVTDLTGRFVLRAIFGATTTSVTVGAGTPTSVAAVPGTASMTTRIGSNDSEPSGQRWKGTIAAVLVTAPLTTDQANSLRSWLTARL